LTQKVLVIGCGIAGPALAIFLKRIGLEPIIFEAEESPNDYAGLFLNLSRNGLRIADELGIANEIVKEGYRMQIMRMYNGKGRLLGEISDRNKEVQGYTIKRRILHKLLREQAERQGINIVFGKRLVDIQMSKNKVEVTFKDGTTISGDMLVGCDGIHSKTRQCIFSDSPTPSYSGLISYGGFSTSKDLPYEHGVQNMIFGKKAFFGYVVKKSGEVYWFGNLTYEGSPTRRELMSIPQEKWKKFIEELHIDDPVPVRQIISQTKGDIGVYPIYDILSQPIWYKGRAILIGDALHATSPNAGQGAALALEDAMLLAKCVRDNSHLEEAFKTFEILRRERVERIVAYSRKIGQKKYATNRVQVFFRDLMLPIFLKATNKQSLEWIYDYKIDWNSVITYSKQ